MSQGKCGPVVRPFVCLQWYVPFNFDARNSRSRRPRCMSCRKWFSLKENGAQALGRAGLDEVDVLHHQ